MITSAVETRCLLYHDYFGVLKGVVYGDEQTKSGEWESHLTLSLHVLLDLIQTKNADTFMRFFSFINFGCICTHSSLHRGSSTLLHF